MIDPVRRRALVAAADRVIPGDAWPSADAAGVAEYVNVAVAGPCREAWEQCLRPGLDELDRAAQMQGARDFAALGAPSQDALLHAGERAAFLRALSAIVTEAYFVDPPDGARPPASWAMIGFAARPLAATPGAVDERVATVPAAELCERYDVIVIGAGAGGGAAAARLSAGGMSVLVVERGSQLSYDQIGTDHVRNHRLSRHGVTASGPAFGVGDPRTFIDGSGGERLVWPHEVGFNNNAMLLGGGTRVYGAQAWRFLPDDFAMASRYGVPEGSSLADWPIGYEDLEPYYELAEWRLGVSGDGAAHPALGPRRRPYPMGPIEPNAETRRLTGGAASLGWPSGPVPLLINSEERDGRRACERCAQCVGFPCPTGAKAGSHNTVLPAAVATGRCDVVVDAPVTQLLTDDRGRVVGVRLVEIGGGEPQARTVDADHVVLAAGAVESARLLLANPTAAEPAGIGNNGDQVGRHLQGHVYSGAYGLFDEVVQDGLGPGPGVGTLQFAHGNASHIGGGLLANDFVMLPLAYLEGAVPPDVPVGGREFKEFVRDGWSRTAHVAAPAQEIPRPDARLRLSPTIRDRFGVPVAMLSGGVHPETLRTSAMLAARAAEWLEASGARRVWRHLPAQHLSGGQHQAGTLRMGEDPSRSVTDPSGRIHGHDNLWVADGSVHVTNGAVNPALTISALAFRTADNLLRSG
ncbi:MAG TPA: GMC family oxidoreductase [Solirubrobacteraceae bacterium]